MCPDFSVLKLSVPATFGQLRISAQTFVMIVDAWTMFKGNMASFVAFQSYAGLISSLSLKIKPLMICLEHLSIRVHFHASALISFSIFIKIKFLRKN